MWQFIKAFFGGINNPPTIPRDISQGIKRPAMPICLEELVEQDQKREAEVKREQDDLPQEQATKRRRLEVAPSSPRIIDLHHQKIQSLHAKLLALQADPRARGHDVNFSHSSTILEPFIAPNNKNIEDQIEDQWLSNMLLIAYVEAQIIKAGQQKNITLCKLTPDQLTGKSLSRFVKKNQSAAKIMWPILEGKHFYLVTIGCQDNQVYISALDGFNSKNTQQVHLAKASELASLLYPDADLQLLSPQIILVQNNVTDCGVVVCYFAEHFIQKSVTEFVAWLQTSPVPSDNPKAPYTPYREKIAEVICEVGNNVIKQTDSSKPSI